MRNASLIVLSVLLLTGCGSDDSASPTVPDSLQALVEELGLPIQRDSLIACAASGQNGFLQESSGLPVSVIYLPVDENLEHWYFESEGPVTDKTDLNLYKRRDLEAKPLLNGFLAKFAHLGNADERTGIVATVSNGKLFLSNEINIKFGNQPTDFAPEQIDIDLNDPLMPAFSWPVSQMGEDAIYFHVVSDADNNLISGTYTIERQFQFYDLSNVVLNINDTNPPPSLDPQQDYTISVMAVSLDNWVNFFGSRAFRTE